MGDFKPKKIETPMFRKRSKFRTFLIDNYLFAELFIPYSPTP